MIRAEVRWLLVELLTGYQKITAEVQVRGVLREMLNDAEPYLRVRNLATEPLLPGAPKLAGVPGGIVNKQFVTAISPLTDEPVVPDDDLEKNRQFALAQGTSLTVRGYAEFPPAADEALHSDMLLKSHFFNLVDCVLVPIGAEVAPWERATTWVNRDQLVGLYLG